MKAYKQVRLIAVVAVALAVMALGGAARQTFAATSCPPDVEACLFVNSDLDTNERDDVLTLREALLITNDDLALADLTEAESGQVVLSPPGWGPSSESTGLFSPPGFGGPGGIGSAAVHFDPTVFCQGCGRTIVLSPPGFGGPGGIGGRMLALPPIGGEDGGVTTRIGLAYDPVVGESPAEVVIDGTMLGADYTGAGVTGEGVWLRGVTFRGFAGAALELAPVAAVSTVIGADGDGIQDQAEVVSFTDNATDIEVIYTAVAP